MYHSKKIKGECVARTCKIISACPAHENTMRKTERVIERLSDILLGEMGKEELTISEMAVKCGISKRKLCNIIYKEKKGLLVETLLTICENMNIDCVEILKN